MLIFRVVIRCIIAFQKSLSMQGITILIYSSLAFLILYLAPEAALGNIDYDGSSKSIDKMLEVGYLSSRIYKPACENGHWVNNVLADGALVELEDGTLWEVDALDHIDVMLWLPSEQIIVCGEEEFINIDSNDRVSVQRIR